MVVTPNAAAVRVSLLVVVAVAAVEDVDPEQLPPLHDSVEPETLDTLVDTAGDGIGLNVRFEYEGYDVHARPGGRLELRPRE
ncbi:hypothetical protein B9G49_00135 [Halorubrum sp. SD683]|nr:hypothetical protein B9G49_00135 [Halorubrum sp. SD683]